MAIIDTLTTIKDYFMSWHDKYYNEIHKETIDDIEQEINDRTAGDADLLRRITYPNFLAAQAKDNTRNQTVQTTLDQYNTKLNTYAKAGKRDLIKDYYEHPEGEGGYARGFYHKIYGRENGLMTWQDKAVLKYTGEWLEYTHDDWPSLHDALTIWVNPTLRIVYCYFYKKDCTWLKSDTSNFSTHGCSSDTAWWHVRPIRAIWAPTNLHGVYFGVGSDGVLHVRSDRKIAKHTLYGSAFWFYRDSNMYDKLRTG
jgi:hypothetical protein